MSKFDDILDGTIAGIDNRRSGLVYTCLCGWIDLGHARPDNAASLFRAINTESGEGRAGGLWYRVDFAESMGRYGVTVSESRSFAVRRGLSRADQEAVALGIFLDVSHRFERLQARGLWAIATDSGYSAEDLVSNLVGFYRVVRPGMQYISACKPVSKAAAQAVWTKYGSVGSLKNPYVGPFLFPCAECGANAGGPTSAMLPPFLSLITPAVEGELYKAWDPALMWEDPVQPLDLGITVYVVQQGDSLSRIAERLYKDKFLWPLIFDSNKKVVGANPHLIRPGEKLLIPNLAGFKRNELDAAARRGRSGPPFVAPPR